MHEISPGTSSNQALARGLSVLRTLVDHGEPMTATEIARQFGLHQSSASRILATLGEEGYVRRTSKGRFAPGFGLLALASATTGQFPLINRPRAAMESLATTCAGFNVSLGMLWNGAMTYFLRTSAEVPTIDFWVSDFPIHLSAPGLRLLLDKPEDEALEILRGSRARNGWRGDPTTVPDTEEGVLTWARENLAHDALVLHGWNIAGESGAAIPIDSGKDYDLALAITGKDRSDVDDATLRLWLHDGRRLVESALR
ncbi:IclR family transcriptional regulator [Propionibacteriaceae bacterium Y1685]